MFSLQLLTLITIPCSWNAANWWPPECPTKLLNHTQNWAHPYGHKYALPALSSLCLHSITTHLVAKTKTWKTTLIHPVVYSIHLKQLIRNTYRHSQNILKTQRFFLTYLAAKSALKWLKVINAPHLYVLLWKYWYLDYFPDLPEGIMWCILYTSYYLCRNIQKILKS